MQLVLPPQHHIINHLRRYNKANNLDLPMSKALFASARTIASSTAIATRPCRRLPFSTATAAMAPNKTALDFVDFVNASPTRTFSYPSMCAIE